MDADEEKIDVVKQFGAAMPHAIDRAWLRIRQMASRDADVAKNIIDQHYQAPSAETLSGIRYLLEKHRELANTAIQQREMLAMMATDQEKTVGKFDEKIKLATTRNDVELANELRRERANYQQSVELTRNCLAEADETVIQVRNLLARLEERFRREEKRAHGM